MTIKYDSEDDNEIPLPRFKNKNSWINFKKQIIKKNTQNKTVITIIFDGKL
jgi:hypothetical protein